MKKMKVLHILNELKYSGAEIMYVDAAPVFQQLGCELLVVNTSEDLGEFAPAFREVGYKVFHEPYHFRCREVWKRYEWMQRMVTLIRENNVDVVHIHAARLRGIMSYVAWKAGARSVYTFHNVFRSDSSLGYAKGFVQRWAAKHVFGCKFQTISNSVYTNERNYWHDKTTLVYNWYGKRRFYPVSEHERQASRRELGLNDDELVLISVGGCSPVKRHTDVIKALPVLIGKGHKVVYLHLGEGVSLDEEKQLAQDLGVGGNVRFLGNKRNVRDYLAAADVYVMPSRYEGISITTIEAMACKIPCVLYNVPGLCDFNKELECSRMIPESYEQLAEAVEYLYNNPSEQHRLTENGFSFISKYFDMEKNARRIFDLYMGGVILISLTQAESKEWRAAA